MSSASLAAGQAGVFAALGDATRLVLLRKLAGGGGQSISRLCEGLKLTRQAVTKHLRVLEGAGLVQSVRAGREARFAFRPQRVAEAREYLDVVSALWDEALERLRAHVEE